MKSETLGERIRRCRTERGIGLRETARQAGISATFLSRIETGAEKAIPAEKVIRKLAAILEDDFDELMTPPLFALEAGLTPTAAIVCRATERKVPAEWQADQFAARLLMPAAAVRTAALAVCNGKLPVWDGLAANRKAGTLDRRLYDLAVEVLDVGNFANVSKEAMSYRLLDLHLVKDSAEATLELF